MKHKTVIIAQGIFLVVIFSLLVMNYPRATMEVNGDVVQFKSINAQVVIISENPDFTNPRYIELEDEAAFKLAPGKYYWKPSNSLIKGFSDEFEIESEVGLGINRTNDEAELVNEGNVRVNITRTKGGEIVGHIILGPDEDKGIEDGSDEKYVGRQDG